MKDDTLAIHGGFSGDRETGATAVPIHQTVSYAYRSAQELADVFDDKAPGYIYTRIANPTTTALELRLIHPGSTIFHEFSAAEKEKMDIMSDMIRVSVGIEDFGDIKADFEQAFEKIS